MRIGVFLIIQILIAVLGTAHAETPVITVSTNSAPFSRKAFYELSKEAFRRAGLEIKLVSLPSERSLQSANAGEVDGEGLRVAGLSSQYANLVQVPEHFIIVSFVAFAKDATINLDSGWGALKSQRVAFIMGWKVFEANAKVARVVHKLDKPEQMFRMLDSGRVDLALYTRTDGIALVRSMGLASIAPLSPPLKKVDMYLYLNKKHEDAVPKIAQALREMKSDGTYNRIMSSLMAE